MSRKKELPTHASSIPSLLRKINKALGNSAIPSVSQIAKEKKDPFKVLVSTLLSLRTKDEVTMEASRRLFRLADNADALARMSVGAIEEAIYPVGFYKTKARTIKNVSKRLINEFDGIVPDQIDELLQFKGVGRKTANLVVTMGYGKPGICVDTHVHRVSNRMGIVRTRSPQETEYALMEVLPKRYWIGTNELLVRFGQNICKPISPHCSACPLNFSCPKVGVGRSR